MNYPVYLCAMILLGGCVHSMTSDERLMQDIERRVSLPDKASPVKNYRRYYALEKDDADTVNAVYVLGGRPDQIWLRWDEVPIVLDGGCSVVNFKYNIQEQVISEMLCN